MNHILEAMEEERRQRYASVPHVDPVKLKVGDRVVFNNDNRWTCSSKVECECECGRPHKGWIMAHRYETQLWWFTSTRLWENSVMLKDWPAKKAIMDEWREQEFAAARKRIAERESACQT